MSGISATVSYAAAAAAEASHLEKEACSNRQFPKAYLGHLLPRKAPLNGLAAAEVE
jgi:hypothetical protein